MTALKIQPIAANVTEYLDTIEDPQKRKDCEKILQIMKKLTGEPPQMWGETMIGFGSYHYKYPSGTEGDWFRTGFSPRKQNISLHIMAGFDQYGDLLGKLGKHKTGKSCLYIKKLEDVDLEVLKKLVVSSLKELKQIYG